MLHLSMLQSFTPRGSNGDTSQQSGNLRAVVSGCGTSILGRIRGLTIHISILFFFSVESRDGCGDLGRTDDPGVTDKEARKPWCQDRLDRDAYRDF